MTPRKTATHIDPVAVIAAALRAIKCTSDYRTVEAANEPDILNEAWQRLSGIDRNRLEEIIKNAVKPSPQILADEMAACGTLSQLQAIKAGCGDLAVKAAWKILSVEERNRLTAICQSQPPEESQPMTEIPTTYNVESPTKKQSLVELTDELQELDNLLDTLEGDIPADVQLAVDELLSQRDQTSEAITTKLDSYCGLIQSRIMWVAARKAESERLAKLAESDTKVVEFLRSRLKAHLEATNQKKLRTKRFNISICGNGGKQPIHVDDVNPSELPDKFQRISVDINREAIRQDLEQGEELAFATFGERGTNLRIK